MLSLRRIRRDRNPSPSPPTQSTESSSTSLPSGRDLSLFPFPETSSQTSRSGSVSGPAAAISRRFTKAWTRRRSQATGEEGGGRGPLGLRLLHSSPEPLLDLVFVHGLNGGSVKTWRKGEDPHLFWPQYWLPMDPGFYNASIHTFGYDSDWSNTKQTVLNVHDFGRSLLEELAASPYLRGNGNAPIILVGHSMGGLVIKKAYILACQDHTRPELAQRIRSIFFLATPHRGSDYAATLNDILKVSGLMSSRDYIADLTTGSTSTELINEGFLAYADQLQIYSFYETLRTNLGVTSVQIVDKSSAVLGMGFRNERVQYLNADHRDICKFHSIDDPNFAILRNALAATIDDLLKDLYASREETARGQMRVLKKFLGMTERPDIHCPKVEGSCEWIDARGDFQEWRDSAINFGPESTDQSLGVYHVTANPGTGKTILAAHVISSFRAFQLGCSYYFFRHGNKEAQSVSGLLRSLAFQMALSSSAIRQGLVDLYEEDVSLERDDTRGIWTKVFKNVIFQAPACTPQYWVVDALDECTKIQDLLLMLKGERPKFPLRIFVTSRKVPEIQRGLRNICLALTTIEIPPDDTMRDLSIYVKNRVDQLPIEGEEDRADVAARLLTKSSTCFLWVRMVLDELESVYGYESILDILDDIPEGMIPFYERTIMSITENKREKHIAKAILTWVVLAPQPMTLAELSQALKLDINVHLPSMKPAVEGLCGQLVVVEEEVVHLVHQTAREFLLSESAGEFKLSRSSGNERLAIACLRVLSSSELQPPRNRRFMGQKRAELSPFATYATKFFSHHVYGASSESDELLLSVDRFLRTNALAWIERLAMGGDLSHLIRTARDFRAFSDRRAKRLSPLSRQVRSLESWAVDLTRVPAMFGNALLTCPSSIHFLVPPLCPQSSSLYRQLIKSADGLSLVGYKNQEWDDCVADISLTGEISCSVECGENFIAVGTQSGKISLFSHRTYQKEQVLEVQHAVDLIHFNAAGKFLAAASSRNLFMWDLSGTLLWKIRLRRRCIRLVSSATTIVGVTQNGHVVTWDVAGGDIADDHYFHHYPEDSESDHQSSLPKAPQVAAISPDQEILALGYREGTICLWSLQNAQFIGHAIDGMRRNPYELIFNPNPNAGLLLVGYTDTHLVVYDSWSGTMRNALPEDERKDGMLSLACSPDGRTAASLDIRGTLRIWDFESLELLYHVTTPVAGIRGLKFSTDGSSIVDLMDSSMRIWSPAALVRTTIDKDVSTSDKAMLLPAVQEQYESLRNSKICHMVTHPSQPIVVVGRWNGDVETHSAKTGKLLRLLHTHRGFVTSIAVTDSGLVASGDVNGRIRVGRLDSTEASGEFVFEVQHSIRSIRQILFTTDRLHMLVSSADVDIVYSTEDWSITGSCPVLEKDRRVWTWIFNHSPTSSNGELILVVDRKVQRYSINDFPRRNDDDDDTLLVYETKPGIVETSISSAAFDAPTMKLVLDICQQSNHVAMSSVIAFDLSGAWTPKPKSSQATLVKSTLMKAARRFIALCSPKGSNFMFLDAYSWISTADLKGSSSGVYTRHFFVPDAFSRTTITGEAAAVRTVDGDVVFSVNGEIAVVKGGMWFSQNIRLQGEF